MGKQSARIYFDMQDHKEIWMNGQYHDAIYLGSELLWEKRKGRKITWQRMDMTQYGFAVNSLYHDITFGKDLFVYIDHTRVGYSSNGMEWESYEIPYQFTSVHYTNGMFIASSINEGPYYSPDAKTWSGLSTIQVDGMPILQDKKQEYFRLAKIRYANGFYIAGLLKGSTLFNWNELNKHTQYGVEYFQGYFYTFIPKPYSFGYVLAKTLDFVTFIQIPQMTTEISEVYQTLICTNESEMFVLANHRVYRTEDGTNFETVIDYNSIADNAVDSFCICGDQYVVHRKYHFVGNNTVASNAMVGYDKHFNEIHCMPNVYVKGEMVGSKDTVVAIGDDNAPIIYVGKVEG